MLKWERMTNLSESLEVVFEGHCGFPHGEDGWADGHINKFYSNDKLEMGHISIIDMREEKGMWMMHVCAFAKPEYPMPIYGFDVVCGRKKITGCFHDVSPTVNIPEVTKVTDEYEKMVGWFVPKRERPLPEWAQAIFSDKMIAAGNVADDKEIDQLAAFGLTNLNNWFKHLDEAEAYLDQEVILAHENAKSKYCYNQLQNPNSKNVMISLGLEKDYVERFKAIQFPY